MTNWQNTALNDAARRCPIKGLSKDVKDIYISMNSKKPGVLLLPTGLETPAGFAKIKVLGKIKLPKTPLVDTIMSMDDENFKYNMNGRYVIHLAYSDFDRSYVVECSKPDFVQTGNSFGPDIEHLMLSIDCSGFIDEDELYEMGGGVPPSSDISDSRQEAEDCGEDPQDWEDEIMKIAEENIRACLQPIIILDSRYEGDDIEAVLVDYAGE